MFESLIFENANLHIFPNNKIIYFILLICDKNITLKMTTILFAQPIAYQFPAKYVENFLKKVHRKSFF